MRTQRPTNPNQVIRATQINGDVCDCHAGWDHVLFRTGRGPARKAQVLSLATGATVATLDLDTNTSFAECGRYFLSFEQQPKEAMNVLAVDGSGDGALRTVASFELPYRKSRRALDTAQGLFVGLYADTALAEGSVLWLRETGAGAVEQVALIENPYPDKQDQFGEDLAFDGRYLYVLAPLDDTLAQNIGTIYVYDVRSPAGAAEPVSVLSDWDSGAKRLLVRAPYMYVAHRDGSISVFEVSDATSIKPVSRITRGRDPQWWAGFGFVHGNVAFVEGGGHLVVVDSDPASGTFGGELARESLGQGLKALPFRATNGRERLALALYAEIGERFEELRLY